MTTSEPLDLTAIKDRLASARLAWIDIERCLRMGLVPAQMSWRAVGDSQRDVRALLDQTHRLQTELSDADRDAKVNRDTADRAERALDSLGPITGPGGVALHIGRALFDSEFRTRLRVLTTDTLTRLYSAFGLPITPELHAEVDAILRGVSPDIWKQL